MNELKTITHILRMWCGFTFCQKLLTGWCHGALQGTIDKRRKSDCNKIENIARKGENAGSIFSFSSKFFQTDFFGNGLWASYVLLCRKITSSKKKRKKKQKNVKGRECA